MPGSATLGPLGSAALGGASLAGALPSPPRTAYAVNRDSPLLYLSGRFDGDEVTGFSHTDETDFRCLSIFCGLTTARATFLGPLATMADLDDWLLAKLAAFNWSAIPLAGIPELDIHGNVIRQRMGLLYSATLNAVGALVLGAAPAPAEFVHPALGPALQAVMLTFIDSGGGVAPEPSTLYRTAFWVRPLGGHTTFAADIPNVNSGPFIPGEPLPTLGFDFSLDRYEPFKHVAGYPYFYGSKVGPLYGDWSSPGGLLVAPSYRSWNPALSPPPYFGGQAYSVTARMLRQFEDAPFLRSIRTSHSTTLESTLAVDASIGGTIQITGLWLPVYGAAGHKVELVRISDEGRVTLPMAELTFPRNSEFYLDTSAGGHPRQTLAIAGYSGSLPNILFPGEIFPNGTAYRQLEWVKVPPGMAVGDYWLEVTTDLGTASSADMDPPQAITVL